eukprot:CAMPEP_0182583872 /NCGR_PEP_ID=MMETSP1324-20130603/56327_1 /TAXON_ID=236786 /ORGANISM="Florenciella sp., Strain RCC1587" /LENGTH=81 /DNA_ID=CAMNT_0024800473 /DNA_START=276 /DNA_END=520 /DNA_ORIENTATION=+
MSCRSNGLASSASGGAGWLGCSAAGAFLAPVDVASSAAWEPAERVVDVGRLHDVGFKAKLRSHQLARNQKGEPCTEPPVAH